MIINKLLREPLVHFVLIGAGLFVLFGAMGEPLPDSEDEILITAADKTRLAASFEEVWNRPPTEAETQALLDDMITEEVLVREAIALGLDQNDTVIRRRLRQKMEFLMSSAAHAMTPSDDQLEDYYSQNAEAFEVAGLQAFEQVFLGAEPSEAEIAAVRASLNDGVPPQELGQRTMLPQRIGLLPRQTIDGQFGRGVFETLLTFEPDQWTGPVQSGFGLHLVRVTERVSPSVPPLEDIRDRVTDSWRNYEAGETVRRQRELLRERYTIVTETGPT